MTSLIIIDNIYVKNNIIEDIINIIDDIIEEVVLISDLEINYIKFIDKYKIIEKIHKYIRSSFNPPKNKIGEYIKYLIRMQDNINNENKEYEKLDYIQLYN